MSRADQVFNDNLELLGLPYHDDEDRITIGTAREIFCGYFDKLEEKYKALEAKLCDHLVDCHSAPDELLAARRSIIKNNLTRDHVTHADRRSGKTSALFDIAEEVSALTSSRVAFIAPRMEMIKAELMRRRINNGAPGQFKRIEVFAQKDIEKVREFCSDVVVDEWFQLSQSSRAYLKSKTNVLAAAGTIPHGAIFNLKKVEFE